MWTGNSVYHMLRHVLYFWVIGLAITLIEIILFPFRLLSLPAELLAGLSFELTNDYVVVNTPSGFFGLEVLFIYIISLLGLILIILLSAVALHSIGFPWRRAMLSVSLALLVSFYLILPICEFIFKVSTNFYLLSDLRFSPGFIINLHVITFAIVFSLGKSSHQDLLLIVSAYLLSFVIAIVIQQIVPGTGSLGFMRNLIMSSIVFVNAFGLYFSVGKIKQPILQSFAIILGMNLLYLIIAKIIA